MPSRSISQLTSTAVGVKRASGIPVGIPGLGFGGEAAAAPDAYAANGFSPDYVADFSAASADYFRVAGNDSDFETAFTSDSEGGGLATMVDSSGNLVWRAHNLLTYSEQFDNADWAAIINGSGSSPVVTANAGTAPDGSSTADRIQFDRGAGTASTDSSLIGQTVTGPGTSSRFAVWMKSYTGADQDVLIYVQTDEASKVVTVTSAWTLFFVDGDETYTNNVRIGTRGGVYGGDQTLDILVWGAHYYRSDLGGMAPVPSDQRGLASSDSYVPTTTAARYLARRRHHRWDGSAYVPTCLHEPVASAQELQGNEPTDFSGSWTTDGATVVSGQDDGWGGTGASLVYPSATGTPRRIYSNADLSIATPTASFMEVKASGFDWIKLEPSNAAGVWFNVSTGTVGTKDSNHEGYIVDKGNGWYQCIVIALSGAATTTRLRLLLCDSDNTTTATANGTDGVIARAAQIEQGTMPSSFIPDGATSRTADTLKGKAASFPWSTTAVSMAVKGRHSRTSGSAVTLLSRYEDADDALELRVDSSNNAQAYAETAGASQTAAGGAVATGADAAFSLAMRYVAGSAIQVATGGTAGSEVTASVPATPPLSDNDVLVLEGSGTGDGNGTVDRIIGWDEDIAAAGLEETSA